MKPFRRRRTCGHAEIYLTPSEDERTALVACVHCPWRVVAALPPIRRMPTAIDAGTALLIDAHALEQLRLGAQIEEIFTRWRER